MIHSDSDAPTLVSSTKSVLHPSLLQSESMTALATMVGGNKAVMKRNTRAFVGDKIEQALLGPQSEKMTKEDEKADVEPHRKGSIGTSTNQSSRSSRQTSLECSPMTATTSLDTDLSDLSKDEHFSLPDALRDIEPPHAVQAYSHSAKAPLRPNPTLPLIPSDGRPKNFGVVVPGVYRSSFPQSEDYPFIEGLKLKTMVTLVQKDFPEGFDAFLSRNGIKHHVFDMKGTKKEAIPITTMKAILRLVLNQANHPLLIHCNHGKHRTGCVVGIVRKTLGWDVNNILEEYRSYAEPKVRETDVNYIQGFEMAQISNLFSKDMTLRRFGSPKFAHSTVVAIIFLLFWYHFSGISLPTSEAMDRKLLTQ
ncbi:tyrosine phosphatase family-domain-containing protein [Neurospora tetraspora]|uniref:diphosphoinositol-polyphosphate diphosphatase n=1 Tax=Neurospora tetraspora TaxID=94610 RepID=A0AAE0MRC9_9PEZI|nr:tyrosine phosphatase family-domain-containing protein [Neurospora tetraspora]